MNNFGFYVLQIAAKQLECVASQKQLSVLYPYLPYALIRLKNNKLLPVNRAYKPLGLLQAEWVDYDSFDFCAISEDIVDLSALDNECGPRNYYYFYEDATSPRLSQKNIKRYVGIIKKALKIDSFKCEEIHSTSDSYSCPEKYC